MPDPDPHPEEIWGCEDPRLTWLPELDQWAIAYTAYSRRGPLVSLAMTHDFRTVRRLGPVMPPEDKDAALFPRRIDGRWAMIHRPSPLRGYAHMWISYSPDLRHWGDHDLLLEARDGAWWDAGKIGLGPPPLETDRRLADLYHGVHRTAAGPIYRVGLGAARPRRPAHGPAPTDEWVFGPDRALRAQRRRQQGRLPVRLGARPDATQILLYYGAADTCDRPRDRRPERGPRPRPGLPLDPSRGPRAAPTGPSGELPGDRSSTASPGIGGARGRLARARVVSDSPASRRASPSTTRTEPAMRRLPGGTVTLVFTDIEGSTALLQALGDRYGRCWPITIGSSARRSRSTMGPRAARPATGCIFVFPSAREARPGGGRGAARRRRPPGRTRRR